MNSHHASNGSHLQVAIDYILKPEKTMNGLLTGSANCIKENAYECMKETKALWGKLDKRQGYHLIISFEENECNEDIAMKVIQEFVHEYLESDYEVVYAVHNNTEHMHGHIIWNSVRFTDGLKYRYSKGDWERIIQPLVNEICEKYGLSTLDPKQRAGTEKEWDKQKDGPFVWNEQIRKDIDGCIIRAYDFQSFINLLEDEGYQIKRGKYLAVKPPGMERFRRVKSLGEGYSESEISRRIQKENFSNYKRAEIFRAPRIRGYKAGKIRKRKLSGIQKDYFRLLYRLGKIKKRSYSQLWKYKNDVKKFKQLQKEYLFLSRNDIEYKEDISIVQTEKRQKVKVLLKAQKVIREEIDKYEKVFDAVEIIDRERQAEIFYRMGDKSFEQSHVAVQEATDYLKEQGYSYKEAKKLKDHYFDLLDKNKSEIKKHRSEINVGYKILKDIRQREERKQKSLEVQKNQEEIKDKRKIKKR